MTPKHDLRIFISKNLSVMNEIFDMLNIDRLEAQEKMSTSNQYKIHHRKGNEIIAIRNKITGEILWKDQVIYSMEYKKAIGQVWFDEYLTGTFFNNKFYENYVRTGTGLYPLHDVTIYSENCTLINLPPTEMNIVPTEMNINGKIYKLVEVDKK